MYTTAVLAKFGRRTRIQRRLRLRKRSCRQRTRRCSGLPRVRSLPAQGGYRPRGLVLTRSMATPGPKETAKLKRMLRYLKGTISIGITNSEDAEDGDKLTAYVDSDFTEDKDGRRSTTSVFLFLAGGPVDWGSMKQTVVALSSMEAEYVAMSKASTMITHHYGHHSSNTRGGDDIRGQHGSNFDKVTPRTERIDIKYTT